MSENIGVAEIREWAQGLEEIRELIGEQFARTEPRDNAIGYIQGLLSDEERKNSWTLSERAGQSRPDGMQRLLSTTDWDPDTVRDALMGYVAQHLGDPAGILAIDETGFLKKGTASAGVARQYSGTAGRVENCQIGVFVTYATKHGRTFVDRELYVPKAWIQDPDRCTKAGIPSERQAMATKPQLAAAMIERVLDADVPAQWVTGDTVYGANHGLRERLQARRMHYVLAVPKNHTVTMPSSSTLGVEARADEVIATLDARAWRERTAGPGTKGDRRYAWARERLTGPTDDGEHWLLARRSLQDPTDLAYYLCYTPANTTLITMALVAGARWSIEETFQTSKGETGLDHYQVRQYTGWYRHITLSMFAHAFLSVIRAKKGAQIQ
ncbi:MAG: IS701 family transposase, partial [Micrococcaceae bacterium]|nr:IS701 family transposase [Micrococcaceae bacterium]